MIEKNWKFFDFRKYEFVCRFLISSNFIYSNFFGVDEVLTNLQQIDQKLTFDVFDILNQDRISKIENIFDGTDPPQKNGHFEVGVELEMKGTWGMSYAGNVLRPMCQLLSED